MVQYPAVATIRVALTLEQCWHRVPGGTGVAGLGMARGLNDAPEVEPVGVAARHAGPPPETWQPPIEVHQLPLPRLALYESWHRLRRPRVERATGPVDVVHATTLAVPPRSAPLVVTIHDLAFLNDPTHFTRRGLSFFRRGLALARRDADLVLCPSEATMRDCATHGFAETKLRLVPMGVEMQPARADDVEAARRRYGLDRPYIMWTGTIEPRKNLRRLLRAYDHLDVEHDLVLVGPQGWNESLQTLLGGVRGRVRVLGFVPHGDLAPLYAGADVFCFPSLFEGFGLPVLEAMSQGTPVVTSRGTSTEELGRDAAVLVDPHADEAIAEGLLQVLKDDRARLELGEAGRRRAARYSWTTTAHLLVQRYREVTS